MKNYYYLLFILVGCGGKDLEQNSYSIPGSSGKISTVKTPSLKEEKNKKSFFLLGPYLTLNLNSPLSYQLNWITQDLSSSFQAEYGTLKEGRKEAPLTKKKFSKNLQFYSASLNPILPNKDYSCTLLRNSLSCYTRPFVSKFQPSYWTAVLIATPSAKKIEVIQKLSPQWIFSSWQPQNWNELNTHNSFFDLSSHYIWNPVSTELNPLRSYTKNKLSLTFKKISFNLGLEFKSTLSSTPTFWMTPKKIILTGCPIPLEAPLDGFLYVKKSEKDFSCSLYDAEGRFVKTHSLN